ncbi:GNAT family N-acetyltransferase [Microbacterium sp. H1-D42]|uniref:GNAT family N-acetyltransferase n=1 Tax=Microbacterium sp. H1-D42 TaxID=2925844 RepID=UPI001F534A20|nr:GNAT family N-acetyltransferase [Microbacterium sp. H1-D42]UNK70745.1 GNAT family N-acetyltransferase [Microbacterium sp. H1-D42]
MASDIATIRLAEATDAVALADLWDSAFDQRLSPDQWLIDRRRLEHTVVAVDDSGICGSIWGLPKRLRESDGDTALVHCIGSVAVAAHARGQGLARRLVAASLDGAADADWALLFTGTPDVYRSSGFETFEMRRSLTGAWAPSTAGERSLDVARTTVGPGAFDWARPVYENSRAGVTLAPVRRSVDWAMAAVRLQGAPIYTVCSGAVLLGYAVARISHDDGIVTGIVDEIAVAPAVAGEAEVWRALLAAITTDWAAAGVATCNIGVPEAVPDSAQHQAIRDFAPDAAYTADRTGMTRALRREPRLGSIRHFTAADYF